MKICPALIVSALLISHPEPGASASTSDLDAAQICEEMLGQRADPEAVSDFLRGLLFWRASGAEAQPARFFPKLHFTIRSDFSILPNCDDHASPKRQPWIPYPVGLVVFILDNIQLDGEDIAVVETEYGLRLLIPVRDLNELAPDITYFFPNDARPVEYCADRPVCTEPSLMYGPNHQYASVSDLIADPCEPHAATLYREGDVEHSTVYVKTCFTNGADNGAVKKMNSHVANGIFRRDFQGIYHRFPESVFTKIFPGTRNYRDCGEETVTSAGESVTGSVSAKAPIYFLELEGSLEAKYAVERSRKFGGDTFHYYSGYLYGPRDAPGELHIIEVIAECDDFRIHPMKPYMIELAEGILIRANELSDDFQTVDGKRSYQETAQTFLRHGQFWVISDIHQYFSFAAILYDRFKQPGIADRYMNNLADGVERWRVANFLAHLVMAASVSFAPSAEGAGTQIDLYRQLFPVGSLVSREPPM